MRHDGLGPDQQVRTELDRVLTRLTTLGARLSRPGGEGGPTPADAVREVLQPLADAVADAGGAPRRGVPVLADRAVADQLAVLGSDLLALLDPPSAGAPALRGGPVDTDDPAEGRAAGAARVDRTAVADLAERLARLRRSLP